MRNNLSIFLLLGISLIGTATWMLNADDDPLKIIDPETASSHLRFVKNMGQWDKEIEYLVQLHGGRIIFESNRLTYHLYHEPYQLGHGHDEANTSDMHDQKTKHHVFRMEFVGGNPRPELVLGKRYEAYHNYFLGNDPTKWAGGVPLFGLLTYKDIYPGIDLRFYGLGDNLKYDFIVHPGADPSDIQLSYTGVDDTRIENQSLILANSLRDIQDMPPIAYQKMGASQEKVACNYTLEDGFVGYRFPTSYDASQTLIIDPTLIFSTYTGSVSNNWGYTATYDEEGNAYAGGIQRDGTVGTGYPTTTGAYQTIFQGGVADATISKFSTDGTSLLYSTYLGGPPGTGILTDYIDQPHSMIVTEANELIVFGRTNSPNFPTTSGAYDETANGDYDLFITKFTADGTGLLGSTLIGGSSDDGVNGSSNSSNFTNTKYNFGDDLRGEVMLDSAGNIYIATNTESADFPIIGSPFQPIKDDLQDGCIVKLDSSLTTLIWSSFLGGDQDDAAYSIALDEAGHLFVAGGTASSNFPADSGLHTTFQGGSTDGFLVKIDSSGGSILNGTFLGTDEYDQIYLLDLDQENNVYVFGQTEGEYPIIDPPAGPVYANSGAKQFISKLSSDLSSIVFSTVFGSDSAVYPNISPSAFMVDCEENIFVSGWGGRTNDHGTTMGMPVTSDALFDTTDGSDFYLMVLKRDAQSLLYASFFGGDNTGQAGDHTESISRFDEQGILYQSVCAGCWGVSTFPTTPGAYSTTNNATGSGSAIPGCNMLVFKIDFGDLSAIQADFSFMINEMEVSFQNTSTGTGSFMWDFGDDSSSTDLSPMHTYGDTGTYIVSLIASSESGCSQDTFVQEIQISDSLGPMTVSPMRLGEITLYPNPADEVLHMVWTDTDLQGGRLTVVNQLGQVFVSKSISTVSRNHSEQISVSTLPEGIYSLRLSDAKHRLLHSQHILILH